MCRVKTSSINRHHHHHHHSSIENNHKHDAVIQKITQVNIIKDLEISFYILFYSQSFVPVDDNCLQGFLKLSKKYK